MKKTILTLATLCLTSAHVLYAQDRTVKGTVKDEKGNPVEYATVNVVGNDNYSTFTDEEGNYELAVPNSATYISIEFGSYSVQTIKISDENVVTTMTLAETISGGETVTTWDGKQVEKTKWVGSADRISSKQLEKRVLSNVSMGIEGNATGVVVANTTGQPGASATIRIRGFSSISGNSDPLYVVDGAIYMGDISSLNTADIESMDILKDATATSQYGSRGSNGVVVITTKSGRGSTKPRISVDAKVGMTSRAIPNYDVVKDPGEYFEYAWDALRNQELGRNNNANTIRSTSASVARKIVDELGGYNPYRGINNGDVITADGKLNPNAGAPMWNDDWDKELQRNGLRQEYNVAAMGSNKEKNSDYYLSLGYLNEKGYVKRSDYERITARLNLNSKLRDWLKVGMNISGAYQTTNELESTNSTAGGYNPFFVSRNFAPIYPVYYYNGNGQREYDPYTGSYKYDWGSTRTLPETSIGTRAGLPDANVLGTMNLNRNRSNGLNFMAVPYLEATLAKGLVFRTTANYNFVGQYDNNYRNPLYGDSRAYNGSVTVGNTFASIYTWNQVLTYEKNFLKDHNISVMLAHENYALNSRSISATRRGLPVRDIYDLGGAAVAVSSNSVTNEDRMESFLSSASYNYKGRYFVNANFRRDGSSRFAPQNRWGNFWSVGGGYIISEEDFMKNSTSFLKDFNLLKIKSSYGTQGNNGSNYYGYMGLVGVTFPNGTFPGGLISQIANPDLKWEAQTMFNVGVDFSYKNRFRGEVAYYAKENADQLFARPFAHSSGITSRLENVMTSVNSGLEVNLNIDVIQPGSSNPTGFLWNVNFNGSTQKNKITKMPDGAQQDTIIQGNLVYIKGHSMYSFYLVESAGRDSMGYELYRYDSAGQQYTTTSASNATEKGRKIVGTGYDKFFGSFTNTFRYKGFDLSFMLTYGLGGYYYDGAYQDLMGNGASLGSNIHRDLLTNRWTYDNKEGALPRAEFMNTDIANNSDRWLIKRDYLNIRNINLGYTFTPAVLKETGISSLRIYVSCDNVWLFTKRQGMDPQSSISGNVTAGSQYNYPATRALIFGVNLGL